jgi:nitrite reductase (NADH) large subunit
MNRYVIVGNGVAGATAADKIRALDPDGPITIFSEEAQSFYYRVRLPEVVSGKVDIGQITIHPNEYYQEKNMDLRLGRRVVNVDPDARKVEDDNGDQTNFDQLLLAAGARSFIPPVKGIEKDGVFALRSYDDARNIAERCDRVESAVLVGGGLLGLEAGNGLAQRGKTVHVVEFFDRLLPRQMDPAGAAKLQKFLEARGFRFYLGAKASEVLGDTVVEGLSLEDGRTIDGGLVLFSAGIRPNLDLAKNMGLETDKGVKVDNRLQTSKDGIFAAGDLIEHNERIYGVWPAARTQGMVAGENMAGGNAEYTGTVMANSLKVVGVDLTAGGDIDPDGKLQAAVYEDHTSYRKIVLDQGKIKGFIFYGTTQGIRETEAALADGRDVSHLADAMANKDFDFSRLSTK